MGDIAFNRMIEREEQKIRKLQKQLTSLITSVEDLEERMEADQIQADKMCDSIEKVIGDINKRRESLNKEVRIRERMRNADRVVIPHGTKCGNNCKTEYHYTRNANWQACQRCQQMYLCIQCFYYDDFIICKSCQEKPPASPTPEE